MSPGAIWAGIGKQLRRPDGVVGQLAGHAMWIANARANALAVEMLAPRRGEDVVEIGCGPGQALRRILQQDVAAATGVDYSPTMIRQARRNNARAVADGRLRLHCSDFSALPLADASVDAVLAVNVAYFMRDASALAEARRVLRPGGRLVLYSTSAQAMRNWPFAGPDTHRLFDAESLCELLASGGFARDLVTVQHVNAGIGVGGLVAVARMGQAVRTLRPFKGASDARSRTSASYRSPDR